MSFLETATHEFTRLKSLAERALEQVDDDGFFRSLSPEVDNSIAVIVKHIAGNLRSRWTDFLMSDGEKPDRQRDREFVMDDGDEREGLMQRWEKGWELLFSTLEELVDDDLQRTVYIRAEPHSAEGAIARSMTHYAYHVGQIVWLARHFAGSGWNTLSVAKGKSEEYRSNPDPYNMRR